MEQCILRLRKYGFPKDQESLLIDLVKKEDYPIALKTNGVVNAEDYTALGDYLRTKISFSNECHFASAFVYYLTSLENLLETPLDDGLPSPPRSVARPDLLTGPYAGVEGSKPVDLLEEELVRIFAESKDVTLDEYEVGRGPAPFLFLLQSTGFGKTRAMVELARKRRVVYLLWKNIEGSWEMPHVVKSVLDDFVDPNTKEVYRSVGRLERKWDRLISAVKEIAAEYETNDELFKAQFNGNGSFGPFYEKLLEKWKELASPQQSIVKPIANEDRPTKRGREMRSTAGPILEQWLIICIDEVSALTLAAYRAYQRTAKQNQIFSLFADTATSLLKVKPNDGASSDIKGGTLGRCRPPFISFRTVDLFWDQSAQDDDYRNLFSAGRPRWRKEIEKAETANKSEKECIWDLIKLAKALLVPHDYHNSRNEFVAGKPNVGMLALFTCRFSLGIRSQIVELLVEHSLATVSSVAEDRKSIEGTYLSEPLLAEASAQYTKDKEELVNVLEHVKSACQKGLLDAPRGDLGEMCAAALLGFCMDAARRKQDHEFMSEAIPLTDFLKEFGLELESDDAKEQAKDWMVNFTHFYRPGYCIDEEHLEGLWRRRLAYYVPAGEYGLDLLIAMRRRDDVGKDEFGAIRVQVKNWGRKITDGDRKTIFWKLLPSCCLPNIEDERFAVSLLLSVNEVDTYQGLRKNHMDKSTRTRRSKGEDDLPVVLELATSFPSKRKNPDEASEIFDISTKLCEICSKAAEAEIDFMHDLIYDAVAPVRNTTNVNHEESDDSMAP